MLIRMLLLTLAFTFVFSQEPAQADFEKWDVARQYGAADTLDFSVTEGTWMNLDVSPDGKEMVFDLVGDIYRMPLSGGKATRLSGGLPFEVQPRFSPDGRHISFTSDRGGGDNIWIMNRDGSQRRQVTEESFRLLNNACWTPDGQYLVARKHFTSTRSLGAGEMWMYHHSGGSGVQLTTRKNDQQDAGEPCISPDGRYLYFSEDMSGGSTFQYNKDPNGQIYVIRRLDLQTGDLISYISGPGGAVRPQISPDGQYLSFIRRIRARSVLFVHKFSTGEQWPVYDQLNKDQQEAWAIFGLYPNYAWLPGSREVVIWAKGKFQRLDIHTRAVREIPFEARIEQSVAHALRYPQQPAPAEFQARMIRQLVTSPDGKWTVFNAAGHLWKMKLPDGKPVRLTEDDGWFEFEPAFSPDGKYVAYVTWHDTALGAIRKVPLRGGRSRKLTARKGYYYAPTVAPDGTIILYRRAGGNAQIGYVHGVEPGLYWISADGGMGNLITEEGYNPRFNSAGDRIYYQVGGGLNKTVRSVRLDGGDVRDVFKMKYGVDALISPDERWVAFQELWNVYITPYPRTGDVLTLDKSSKAIPLKQVSRDAGTNLHWSRDSQRLHWTIGPQYFTRELKNTFAFVEGAPDSLPAIAEAGDEIELFIETDVPSGFVVLRGARIITMNGDRQVIEDGTIVVEGNRIVAVGPTGSVALPEKAAIIDCRGKTIMPGIIDVHAHAWHFGNPLTAQQNWPYYANLAYGITAMHDPSATTEIVFAQRELVESGGMVGPRVFSTGTILYGADGDFKAPVESLEDARSHLRRMKAVGAFSVKSYNQPRREQRQQVIQAARELQMMVYPEGGSFFYHNMSMILDGHTGIEHNIPVVPAYDDILTLWSSSGTANTPTLVVSYGSQSGERYWYQHMNVWDQQRLLNFMPRALLDAQARRVTAAVDEEYGHFENAAFLKAFTDRGGRVNVGGHGQLQGLAPHWEMWMFAQGGMTPMEVLAAATVNGAYYLGMEDDLGSLAPGKLADLLVLDKNPLENIRHSDQIQYVMKNGRIYDAMTMNEIGNHPRKRHRFWWEHPHSSDAFVWRPGLGFGQIRCGCGR